MAFGGRTQVIDYQSCGQEFLSIMKVYNIIEVANVHGGDIQYLLELIDTFKEFKENFGIKFQPFKYDLISTPDYSYYSVYEELYYNKGQWKEVIERAVVTTGTYSVKATNSRGCIGYDTITVTISGIAPVPSFLADTVCFGGITTFTDMSAVNPPDSIVSWLWNFGDASAIDTTQSPSHTFPDSGFYNVTLTVTTNTGCNNVVSNNIYVNPLPIPAFQSSLTFTGDTTFFTSLSGFPGSDSIVRNRCIININAI